MGLYTTGVFFSPTGGTRRALECFLKEFDPHAAMLDATCPPRQMDSVQLGEGDVLVLAFLCVLPGRCILTRARWKDG